MAAGSTASAAYGVNGIPQAYLIGPDGKVLWAGSPGESVSKSTVKKLIKGARPPRSELFALGFEPELGIEKRLEKARDLAQDGSLASASAEVAAILADEGASEGEKKQAKDLQTAIDRKAKTLAARAESYVKARDVELAIRLLEAISKEFASSEPGANASKRLAEIGSDAKLKTELEAIRAFERVKEQIKALKPAKAKPKIEEFVKKNPGTRAAERAQWFLRSVGSKKS